MNISKAAVLGLWLIAAGCSDEGRELFETAQFEERQHNQAHAAELYRDIVSRYPNTDYGRKAAARLKELEAVKEQP